MNTEEVKKKILQFEDGLRHRCLGVFAANQLPACNIILQPGNFMVINTDPIEKSGTHWLAVYCPIDSTEKIIEVFDSYGYVIETYPIVKDFLINRCLNESFLLKTNIGQVQQEQSNFCGLHCIFFLGQRIKERVSMRKIINEIYTNNLKFNDCLALYYYYTNKNL